MFYKHLSTTKYDAVAPGFSTIFWPLNDIHPIRKDMLMSLIELILTDQNQRRISNVFQALNFMDMFVVVRWKRGVKQEEKQWEGLATGERS